uniref:Uncharacterized protein n=1 Tax=Kalanchoe fedtschenkoi TaxID=63787 RepID=A0A7N0UNM9_KALFE
MRRRSSVPPDLGFPLPTLLLISALLSLKQRVEASIHEYRNEAFVPRHNSFFFHGGSEGMHASAVHNTKDVSDEKSYIRFESITFRRPKKVAEKQNAIQLKTGLVEAIILEVRDRDKIGGSTSHPDDICCNPELSRMGLCRIGEVIIRHNPDTPEWPNRIQTFFEGSNEEAKMDIKVVEINSTGMYYLYFVFCDPELKGTLISGKTVWRNPDGYLPGKMAPMMTF